MESDMHFFFILPNFQENHQTYFLVGIHLNLYTSAHKSCTHQALLPLVTISFLGWIKPKEPVPTAWKSSIEQNKSQLTDFSIIFEMFIFAQMIIQIQNILFTLTINLFFYS